MASGRDFADTVGLQALGWLVAHDEVLAVFLGASGLAPDDLRRRAGDPEFLGSVLDFILTDDAMVMAFCDAVGLGYEAPQAARRALPGGQEMNWT